jgi:hypothetical protein
VLQLISWCICVCTQQLRLLRVCLGKINFQKALKVHKTGKKTLGKGGTPQEQHHRAPSPLYTPRKAALSLQPPQPPSMAALTPMATLSHHCCPVCNLDPQDQPDIVPPNRVGGRWAL